MGIRGWGQQVKEGEQAEDQGRAWEFAPIGRGCTHVAGTSECGGKMARGTQVGAEPCQTMHATQVSSHTTVVVVLPLPSSRRRPTMLLPVNMGRVGMPQSCVTDSWQAIGACLMPAE